MLDKPDVGLYSVHMMKQSKVNGKEPKARTQTQGGSTMDQTNNEVINSLCRKVEARDRVIDEMRTALRYIYDQEPAGISKLAYTKVKAALATPLSFTSL